VLRAAAARLALEMADEARDRIAAAD